MPCPGRTKSLRPIVWLGQLEGDGGQTRAETLGCLLLADVPRSEAKEALADLRTIGVSRILLLTGDRRHVAEEIGKCWKLTK